LGGLSKKRTTTTRGRSSTKYLGVSWSKYYQQWNANLYVAGTMHGLGRFGDNEIEAARAVDAYIVKKRLNKELNFPGDRATAVATAAAAAARRYRYDPVAWAQLQRKARVTETAPVEESESEDESENDAL